MAATNLPEDLGTWKRDIERQLRELRDRVGNVSGFVGEGGLQIGDGGSLKMVSVGGVQILFFGPDPVTGKQIIRIKRDNGADVFFTYYSGSNQFWALTDNRSVPVVSDDAFSGVGLARPWLPVDMHPLFDMAAGVPFGYRNLPVAQVTSATALWEGRLVMASHPKLEIDGVWGQASGANNSTYRLIVDGTQIGSWSETGLVADSRGPFDIAPWIDLAYVPIQVTVQASGTGNVACQVLGCAQRQS